MTSAEAMSSSRPYLVRAVHEWIVDNDLTPQIVVDAAVSGVAVPAEFVEDGRIVLNLAPRAVRGLSLGNDLIEFEARFGGRPFRVSLPPRAVLGVFARENGAGMAFPEGEEGGGEEPPPEPGPAPGRPKLKVVK